MVDMSEGALFKQIQEGNPAAIFFHLKTMGKKRGYVERQEVMNMDDNSFIEILKRAEQRKANNS